MGGDFSYEYIGKYGSSYRYRLTIEMYRDCQQSTTQFDYSIEIGVYHNNATRNRYTVFTMFKSSETSIEPPSGGSNCAWKPQVCIRKGVYTDYIDLPATTTGYHLVHLRCCRNSLNNILYNTGQTYYAYIPPNAYEDNSPTFTGIPTPYICAQDTVNISYAAADVDGDSLVYSLVRPYAGGSDLDPIPDPVGNLNLPIVPVPYATSYSVVKPFGPNGICSINSATGLVKVYVPASGLYAIAVEVKSYRNGQLITTIRRDIELIVLNCPTNYLPRLAIPGGITSYVVEEGNTLSFDIPYTDTDSMYFTAEGDVFGGISVQAPYASLAPVSGIDTVSSTFTWNTSCEHGRSNPYFFTVKVKDNGCPYKTTITIFQIFVIPFEGPDSISGPADVCEFDDSITYKAHGISQNSLINWTISGGNILSGIGTDTVKVRWGPNGSGLLKVFETSQFGCGPEMVSKNVSIHSIPVAEAGPDVGICSGDSIIIGDTNANTNLDYIWHTSDHISDSSLANPVFSMQNNTSSPILLTYYLKVRNSNNCESSDSMQITVYPPASTSPISGPVFPCFQGVFTYSVTKTPLSQYFWSVEGGTQVSGRKTSEADIHWTDSTSGKLSVYEVNQYGCLSDTQDLYVNIVRPDAEIIGPAVVCPNTIDVKYWVNPRQGSHYDWFVNGGIRTDSNGHGSSIRVSWPDSGTAMIKVVETTIEGCVSDTDYFPVIISYRLETSDIAGDTFVCAWSKNKQYSVMNVNGSTYDWWIDGGWIINGNGLAEIASDWGSDGIGMLKVLETSYDSVNDKYCYGDTVYQPVVINPYPVTTPVSGPKDVCEYDTAYYSVNGFDGSVYFWTISDTNIIFEGQGNDSIVVFWQTEGDYTLQVVELSKDSCFGDVIDTLISVHPNPKTSEILGDDFICYPNNLNIPYSVNGFTTSDFNWSVMGGDLVSSNMLPDIKINWTTVNTGIIEVREVTEWGCVGPIKQKYVQVDSLAPVMQLVTTLPSNDLEIQVDWDFKNAYHLTEKAALYKHSALSGVWSFVDSFLPNQRDFIDKLVKTHSYSYQYKISVTNLCGEKFFTYPHNSILLQGEKVSDFDLYLHWTDYANWPEGVNRYEIYRETSTEANYELVTSTTDTMLTFEAGLDGIHQCFRIIAVQEGNENVRSWSNKACFEFDPVMRVPNAFTPNNDGLNDSFVVISANIASFDMQIFNKWGEMVYQSNDRLDGWDGSFRGRPAPIDVYVVVIKYQGNTPEITYTGNISLIR
jgi:gliding motility-associated-like protein